MKKNFFPNTILKVLALILFSFIFAGIGVFIIDNIVQEVSFASLNILMVFAILFPCLLVILYNKRKNTPITFFEKKYIKIGFLSVLFAPIILLLIDYALSIQLNYPSKKEVTFSALSVSVIAPIFEELYFRGIILNGLMQRYKKYHYIIAFIISNCLFTFVHSPEQYIFAFLAGTYLSFSFISTRNILFPIAIHIIFNSMNYFFR
ncbi:lysostaphin resistance A-like protein [Ornithobacterium rhinotracheale]|uniref:CPBP family intramembrane glutamic endopeptidase n=1 Tax=Ornithobacterium rhinotracheale TaxID=28251 RepID=UPI003FA4BE9D